GSVPSLGLLSGTGSNHSTISSHTFHAYLADLADCENECFPYSWLIFARICSLIETLVTC
uniref:Uncharacterized protein n=1 Tax=Crocodylus porosus TaxID=8502 RepID=A0A7M4FJQ8_CROPO